MKFIKVAVSGVNYSVDRPYEYAVPDALEELVSVGKRVLVPFGRYDRQTEAMILSVANVSSFEKCKDMARIVDDFPVVPQKFIRLAFWMREQYFCTVYDCLNVMIPAGDKLDRRGEKKLKQPLIRFIGLCCSGTDAQIFIQNKKNRAPMQAAVIRTLMSAGQIPCSELKKFTGASDGVIKSLLKDGMVEISYEASEDATGPALIPVAEPVPKLNTPQNDAFLKLRALLGNGLYDSALLYGVTGSGKTAVYLNLIQEAISAGKSCIVMVPEISLTPQMLKVFSDIFPSKVAVLHSGLSLGERTRQWNRIASGKVSIVIGTRSAVFAPVQNLGLVIIDEEQEESYKAENSPRYNAKEVAEYRCREEKAILLMGSATPSVETMYRAKSGDLKLLTLPGRFNDRPLPKVRIADMKKEAENGHFGLISRLLQDEIDDNLKRGEQSILLINRRGTSKVVTCGQCSYVCECPNCSTTMFYHGDSRRMICHYCGHTEKVNSACPNCGGSLLFLGDGIQKAEEELHSLFPSTEVLRVDSDAVSSRNDHQSLFARFQKENIPIMLGTQMVAKGLNFENVTLTGILSADMSLYSGNYRCSERTFSLITQAIGRSGRYASNGRAVIQTYSPQHFVIQSASNQDYDDFYLHELPLRSMESAPPYTKLFVITFTGKNERDALTGAECAGKILKYDLARIQDVKVLGPAPYPVMKLNNEYRYKLTVAAADDKEARSAISKLLMFCSSDRMFSKITVHADSNPLN